MRVELPRSRTCRFDSVAENDSALTHAWGGNRRSSEARRLHGIPGMLAPPLIAIAEDNPQLRALLASALEKVGYRVVQAATGEGLVAEVRRLVDEGEPLRLIITDVRMPTLGGVEAARLLREAGHTTPMIFMTAYGDAWTRTQAASLGAVLLDKPQSLNVLRQAVMRLIAP